jgi:curved DNA-binding protein CbpA
MTINPNQDYYAVLGVAPTAEDFVIKAAYKALMQRYHPDRASINGQDTTKKVAEINEAYRILSNKQTRKEYDELRGVGTQSAGDAFDEQDIPKENPEFIEGWHFACEYYPHLKDIEGRLKKVSWRLALAFQAMILDTKFFLKADQIATSMEQDFLTTYFGSNNKIIEFARKLISSGNQNAARELNKAIKILGEPENPEQIISTIAKKYDISGSRSSAKPKSSENAKTISVEKAKNILHQKGYKVIVKEYGWLIIEPLGGRQKIKNELELSEYALSRESSSNA